MFYRSKFFVKDKCERQTTMLFRFLFMVSVDWKKPMSSGQTQLEINNEINRSDQKDKSINRSPETHTKTLWLGKTMSYKIKIFY